MKSYVILCLLFFSILSSCAIVTKGKLDEMSGPLDKPQAANKNQLVSIEYRVFSNFQLVDEEAAFITSNQELDQVIEAKIKQLQDSNIRTVLHKNNFEQASFKGSHYQEDLEKRVAIPFPIKSDYFIQLEIHNTSNISSSLGKAFFMGILAPLHIMSLGLIPITTTEDFYVKATLFNQDGKILQQNDIHNEARLWLWTPLVFAGGTSLFVDNPEVLYAPAIATTADHALHGLKFNP
jgi:predicted RNA binding protein YcfA (HicA-like mRNA interferase family)